MSEQDVFDALKYRIDIDRFGTRYYYNADNKLHRTVGPAVLWTNGVSYWFQNGQLHRTDGPAIELDNGHKEWWQNGKRHRTDGAAIEYSDGDKAWFINGEELSENEFNQRATDYE